MTSSGRRRRNALIGVVVVLLVAVVGATTLFASLFLGGKGTPTARSAVAHDAGCADLSSGPSPAAMTTPLMDEVAREDANTDLFISSDASDDLRLTVWLGDEVAYDAEVRGAGDCMHPPIYRSSYRLPPGQVRVRVTASDGRTRSMTFSAGRAHRWLTVGVQDGFPLRIDVWKQRPSFG